jgi:CubicO group peptidase (beta-lactamase class C family)
MKRRAFLSTSGAAAAALLCGGVAAGESVVVRGEPYPKYADFDNLAVRYMVDKQIRAGQLAFGRGGSVLFSHAYTAAPPPFMRTSTTSIFRVASISKMFTAAGITELLAAKRFTLDTPLFPYIGVRTTLVASQRPDPRIDAITIGQAVAHTAGLAPSGDGDPEFKYRAIENAVGARGPLTQAQFARYVYGLPLRSNPGESYAYSNIGYFLLGRVVEKASGMQYLPYLQTAILEPLGIGDAVLSATAIEGRRANEAFYDADGVGLSVLDPRSQEKLPVAYGGATYWETFDACSDVASSAASLVVLASKYAAWGIGSRAPGSARAGAMPGTQSVVRNRKDGVDYAFVFDKRAEDDPFNSQFRAAIEKRMDRGV